MIITELAKIPIEGFKRLGREFVEVVDYDERTTKIRNTPLPGMQGWSAAVPVVNVSVLLDGNQIAAAVSTRVETSTIDALERQTRRA